MRSLIGQSRKVQCQVLGNIEKYRYVLNKLLMLFFVLVDSKHFGKQPIVKLSALTAGFKTGLCCWFLAGSSFPARPRSKLAGLQQEPGPPSGGMQSMARTEAPPDSSAGPRTLPSLCSAGTSLSASACKSAAEPPRTCAKSVPACCGWSHPERGSPDWPEEQCEADGWDVPR